MTPKPRGSTMPEPTKPERRLGVMGVARRLRVRYQKARDLMLTGQLGETLQDERHMTVPESGVVAYELKRRQRRGGG